LVVHAPPKGSGTVFGAILDALEKDTKLANPQALRDPIYAARWLRAERITDVIIFGSHRVDEDLKSMIDAASRPWLVTPSKDAAEAQARKLGLKGHGSLSTMFRDLERRKADRELPEKPLRPTSRIARLPSHDFPAFLAVCHQLIREPDAFAAIEREFLVGQSEMNRLLDRGGGDPPNREVILSEIHSLLVGTASDRESICRLRGIQAGLFSRGIGLGCSLKDLLGVLHLDRQTHGLDGIARSIRSGIDPLPGAVAVIAYITSLTPDEMVRLRKNHVALDGGTVRFRGNEWDVPERLRAPLAMCRDPFGQRGQTGNSLMFRSKGAPLRPDDVELVLWRLGLRTDCRVRHPAMIKPARGIARRRLDDQLELFSLKGKHFLI
jgi:hypothetical protein